jgi:LTXXQ motif family protein
MRFAAMNAPIRVRLITRLPVQRIEEVVKPTGPQQQTALDQLKQASAKAADDLRASCPAQAGETPTARLDAMNNRLDAMVQAAKTLRPRRTRARDCPSMASHQINQREYADPDDIQRVPEQAPAQQTPQHGGSEALNEHLGHQIDERDQTAGDVDAVRAH